MRRIALVGKNLSSSFSIKFFNEKIKKENIKNLEYVNLEINRIDQLHNYIKKKNIILLFRNISEGIFDFIIYNA